MSAPTTPASVLLVEDKDSLRNALRLILENKHYAVTEAADARAAINLLSQKPFQIVLTDLRMPNGTGIEVLQTAKKLDKNLPVIVMTAFGSIDEAVEAMKLGAYDFLQKPVDTNHLLLLIERALEQTRLKTENLLLREEFSRRYGFPRIIGESASLKRVVAETQKVAETNATVLLLGESGTGKELFARAVHHLSPRRDKSFVTINCAAIPETLIENELFGHEKGAFTGATERRLGKFELAAGGTIFLDEIGELPLPAQGKLLRVLEEKTVDRVGGSLPVAIDVRIVAATNKNLKAASETGEFRLDLFYRLAVFPIEIPALRERGDDLVLLAEYFADKFGREFRQRPAKLNAESLNALRRYNFPGNVRELQNLIERACILADSETIDLNLNQRTKNNGLRTDFNLEGSLSEVAERASRLVEKQKITETLALCAGNKTRAAERLAVSYKTLLTKIKELEIE